jgi:predicted secreted hydrolase
MSYHAGRFDMVLLVALLGLGGCSEPPTTAKSGPESDSKSNLSLASRPNRGWAVTSLVGAAASSEGLDGGPAGSFGRAFERAVHPRRFQFPADHGPHRGFQTEWWYFTGNVETKVGREFGFHLTFFRFALPRPAAGADVGAIATRAVPSGWRTTQVYMAHFAVTDVSSGRMHSAERFQREAMGLAGARAEPFEVWVGDWRAQRGREGAGAMDDGLWPLHLRARAGDSALSLELVATRPLVLNGQRGLSRKSAESGNASYYYSATRLAAKGTIIADGSPFEVTGLAWMDREWSTSALAAHQVGWDWFSLQLSDGTDLMLALLRTESGAVDPFSAGTLVSPGAQPVHLLASDAVVDATASWTSPSGVRYPARWRVRVPRAGVDIEVWPKVADQEMKHSVRYWEGAVALRGRVGDGSVTGHGYVELAGY